MSNFVSMTQHTMMTPDTMTHTYTITGMTCTGCQAKVQQLLGQVEGVRELRIDLSKAEASVRMDRLIPTDVLQSALKDYPKYRLMEAEAGGTALVKPDVKKAGVDINETARENTETAEKSWLATYKPILLIFGYITVIALIAGSRPGGNPGGSGLGGVFDGMLAMRVFMSGFFLTFSFFKMLNLKGFAESYAMYDIVAGRFKGWGYVYGFIELGLGIAFALNFQPFFTNLVTLVVMSISIIGVLKSVFSKRKIRCACLGAVFNLPMSTVTIVEDAVMILMSGMLLIGLL